MGIPLTVFTLHRFANAGAGCAHHLLLRVEQPAFSNADADDYDRAVAAADERRQRLIRAYAAGVLATECAAPHDVSLVGELQSYPVGDELIDGAGGGHVELWVAETRHGAPWVVMGTAADEDAFWRAVESDEELASLGPIRPAVRLRTFFLAEQDDAASPPGDPDRA